MNCIQLLTIGSRAMKVYGRYCRPVLRKHHLNQTALDVMLFLANNPEFNTARDICTLRGIKSGIVSVTVESLIRAGYLTRENDPDDRRIQRLAPTARAADLIRDGRAVQKTFADAITGNLTFEELQMYARLSKRLMDTIEQLDAAEKD